MVGAENSALLLLHWQNGVAHPDGVWGKDLYPQIEKGDSIENTQSVLAAARDAGMAVIYVNIAWRPGFPELTEKTFALLRDAQEGNECLRGSWGAQVIDELEPTADEIEVINFGSDGFEGTDLDVILRTSGIDHVYVAGQCIEHVVATTAKRAANMGYSVTVLEDCTSGFTDQNYDAMLEILPLYGEMMTADEFVDA